jgi:hypothetical protein
MRHRVVLITKGGVKTKNAAKFNPARDVVIIERHAFLLFQHINIYQYYIITLQQISSYTLAINEIETKKKKKMESATSNNDTSNTTTSINMGTTTVIVTRQGKENHHQLPVNHIKDQDNIIHHDKNDENVVIESKTKKDENGNEDMECSCPICLRTASELWTVSGHNPSNPKSEQRTGNNTSTGTGTGTGTSDKGFVYSSTCGHIYCVPCIQHMLLYSSSVSVSKRTNMNMLYRLEDDEATPGRSIITLTQGLCPLCRAKLSYFDLKKIHIQKDKKSTNKEYKIIRTDETIVPKADISTLPKELYGTTFQSNESSTFIQFPKDKNDDTGIELRMTAFNPNDDGQKCLIMKLQEYQYLSTTHTFKGWGKTSVQNANQGILTVEFCVWMTFSDNFMFVTHGVGRFTIRNTVGESISSLRLQFDDGKTVVHVLVYGGDSGNHMIRVINPTTTTNLDRTNNSIAITPKRSIRYKNSTYWGNIYCQHYKIGFASYHFITKPVIGNKKKGKANDNNNSNSTNGVAFISYEHVATTFWLPLDDGRPIPSRVLFRNIRCPDQYTFCGSICWEEDYNTTWQGSSRWDYKIKFDTKFMCIVSGTVHSVKTNGTKLELKSTFGDDLIYVNAGLYDSFTEHMVSKYGDRIRELKENDSPFPIIDMVRKFSIYKCELISDRLIAENVTSETGVMLIHVLKAATYNINNGLLEILKEKPNSDVAAINCGMEKEFNVNPIDSECYYE